MKKVGSIESILAAHRETYDSQLQKLQYKVSDYQLVFTDHFGPFLMLWDARFFKPKK